MTICGCSKWKASCVSFYLRMVFLLYLGSSLLAHEALSKTCLTREHAWGDTVL